MSQQQGSSPPPTPAAGQAIEAIEGEAPVTYAQAGECVNVASPNPAVDNEMQSADHFHERTEREGGLDSERTGQLGELAEKFRERNIAEAKKEAAESELKKKRLEVEELRAKVRSLRAERDERDRQRREEIHRKIAEGDPVLEQLSNMYDQTLRRRKVMETVQLLHDLTRAKRKGDTDVIPGLEEKVAGIDANIVTEAQTELDKARTQARANLEGVSTGKAADPQHSGNVVDSTTRSAHSQSSGNDMNLPQ